MKLYLYLFITLFFTTFPMQSLAKVPTLSQEETKLLNTAYEEHKKENYNAVISMLTTMVNQKEKAHPFAYSLYGVATTKIKQYEKALKAYEKALSYYPTNYNLNNNYALTLSENKQHEKAGNAFLATINYAPNEQKNSLRFMAAQSFYTAKKYNNATKQLDILLQSDKNNIKYLELSLANSIAQKNWNKANQVITKLIALSPYDKKLWRTLTGIRVRQHDLVGTASALEISNTLEPNQHKIQALAELYAKMHAPTLTLSTLKKLPNTSKNQQLHLHALIQSAKLQDAIHFLAKQETKNAENYFLQGILFTRLLQIDNAQKSFEKGATLQGDFADKCKLLIALHHWENGDIKKAQKSFTSLLSSNNYALEAKQSLHNLEIIEKEMLLMKQKKNNE